MNNPILYVSTNRRLPTARPMTPISFRDALFMGIAPDGGLFVPTHLPNFTPAELQNLQRRPYHEIAFHVLQPFLFDTFDEATLRALLADAYNFALPLESLDRQSWLLRLDHGPTASFKDFAARFMARAMHALKPRDMHLTILVATSGDTGSAVGEAFHGLDGIRVVIVYPADEVSAVQKHQLDAIGGNVSAVMLSGTFDDCQRLVKRAFLDPDLRNLQLTSANSINIGRILPQCVYYFHGHAHVAHADEQIVFSIPSGNFGNSFGCELARRMGLPVRRMIIAVNENDEFPRFLAGGAYQPISPSRNCPSNAMNVGNPSNLARYFDYYGGVIDKDGVVHVMPDRDAMRAHLFSVSISNAETLATMRAVYRDSAVILEPHGAVGVAALRAARAEHPHETAICLETAHPAKYADIIRQELAIDAPAHPALLALQQKTGRAHALPNDYQVFKEFLHAKKE